MPPPLTPIQFTPDRAAVRYIDQTRLPEALVEVTTADPADLMAAIGRLAIRGAPAIGVAAAMGLALLARRHTAASRPALLVALADGSRAFAATRPTAVNLAHALERMLARATATPGDAGAVAGALADEAQAIADAEAAMSRAIGEHALTCLGPQVAAVLTHCNAGALAAGGLGTALAPVYLAHERGRRLAVWATETRPLRQGARLTAFELSRAGIPVTLLVDGAAAALLSRGEVQAVLVGADRIAANGDVANKVGTYALALAAHAHGVPFVVCAPSSTVDPAVATGSAIPIEQRGAAEVLGADAADVAAWNPAFDVTPAALVTAIVTDRGVHRPPYAFTG